MFQLDDDDDNDKLKVRFFLHIETIYCSNFFFVLSHFVALSQPILWPVFFRWRNTQSVVGFFLFCTRETRKDVHCYPYFHWNVRVTQLLPLLQLLRYSSIWRMYVCFFTSVRIDYSRAFGGDTLNMRYACVLYVRLRFIVLKMDCGNSLKISSFYCCELHKFRFVWHTNRGRVIFVAHCESNGNEWEREQDREQEKEKRIKSYKRVVYSRMFNKGLYNSAIIIKSTNDLFMHKQNNGIECCSVPLNCCTDSTFCRH